MNLLLIAVLASYGLSLAWMFCLIAGLRFVGIKVPEFVGFGYHDKSIESAKQRAKDAGVSDRIRFEVAKAQDYPGKDYDFVTFFDSLHDMGDPAGASAHMRSSLKSNGTWMIVEPFAGDEALSTGFDVALYARVALPGSRLGARSTSRRKAFA